MTGEHWIEGLQQVISAQVPLAQIVSSLREYRRQGVTRHEVQSALEALRESAPDEATEDRILEVMDIVSGFCPRESTVWQD
jgi:anthranilate phosphoribosyltransferase